MGDTKTMPQGERYTPTVHHRVWTVPNVISFLRIVSIALIAWLIASSDGHPDRLLWALFVMTVSAASDGVDGWIARRFDQVSDLGQLLDPLADRLLIISCAIALCVSGVVHWSLMILIAARDIVMLIEILILSDHGYCPLPVHFVGKTGTFLIMSGIVILVVSHIHISDTIPIFFFAHCLGYALYWWGIGFYWIAGIIYLIQGHRLLRGELSAQPVTTPVNSASAKTTASASAQASVKTASVK